MNITERAMLMKVVTHIWGNSKKDSEATREYAQSKGAKEGTITVVKKLVPDEEWKQVADEVHRVKGIQMEKTLPWDKSGWKILPVEIYFDLCEEVRKQTAKMEKAIERFAEVYEDEVEKQRVDLGDLFNPFDYPSVEAIKRKFGVDVKYMGLPDVADFRVDLSEKEINSLRKQMQNTMDDAFSDAQKDAWQRLYDLVKRMSENLKKDNPRIHETLIGNISDLCEILPKLNIMKDPHLDEVVAEAKKNLGSRITENLRTDKKERKVTAEEADKLLKKMAGYMG